MIGQDWPGHTGDIWKGFLLSLQQPHNSSPPQKASTGSLSLETFLLCPWETFPAQLPAQSPPTLKAPERCAARDGWGTASRTCRKE